MQDPDPSALTSAIELAAARRGSWLRGWWFRFGFVYWMIFCGEQLLGQLPVPPFTWLAELVGGVQDALIVGVGRHVLGITGPIALGPSGSGDRTADWIDVFAWLVVSAVAGALWLAIDRRRAYDPRLRAVLRVVMRYALGFAILGYGVDKLFGLQFTPPSDAQLMQRWGESSPMNVLWNFMASSPTYEAFTGAAEVTGAVLVLFRRTTLLGALLLASVMVNVVMLNFCYDVGVKLYSMHLLALCGVVLAPDLGRLFDVIVRHRAVAASPVMALAIASRRGRIARWVVKYGMFAIVLVTTALWVQRVYMVRKRPALAHHWAAGSWHVTSFVRDGRVVAIDDEPAGWERLRFVPYGEKMYVRWQSQNAGSPDYLARFDDAAHELRLVADPNDVDTPPPVTLRYAYDASDAKHLALTGEVDGARLEIKLTRDDTRRMLLRTRGFHWIDETSFDR